MNYLFVLFPLSFLIYSCADNCVCQGESLLPKFVSYAESEIDTIFVRKFRRGTAFGEQVDSFTWDRGKVSFINSGDSIMILPNRLAQRINEEFDWRITNPFDGKTQIIGDIEIDMKFYKCGGIFSMDPPACVSPLISYVRNGVLVMVDKDPLLPATFEIRK